MPADPVWEHGHSKSAVAVRGAVVDLLLVLLRRVPPGQAPIEVLGNATVLAHWSTPGSRLSDMRR